MKCNFELDSRSLSAFRLTLGINLIWAWFVRYWPIRDTILGHESIIPKELIFKLFPNSYSIFHLFHNSYQVYFYLFLTLAFFVVFTSGRGGLVTKLISYIMLWNIQQKNPVSLDSVDHLLNYFLFLSLLVPTNEHFTIGKNTKEFRKIKSPLTFLFLVQIGLVYFINSLTKVGMTWKDGSAINLSLLDTMFVRESALWLHSFPYLCKLLTIGLLTVEFLLFFFILSPWKKNFFRYLSAILILLLHWGVNYFINLGPFHLLAICSCVVLLPSNFWNRIRFEKPSLIKHSPSKWSSFLASILLLLILKSNYDVLCNYGRFKRIRNSIPGLSYLEKIPSINIDHASLLNQNWTLYSPDPPYENGHIEIIKEDKNGGLKSFPNKGRFSIPGIRNLADNIRYFYEIKEYQQLALAWVNYEFKKDSENINKISLVLKSKIAKKTSPLKWELGQNQSKIIASTD